MDMQNYKPATSSSTKARVVKTIREEIMQGNYVITSSKPTVVNGLGAIPMPNSTEIRIIYDCSRLHRQAVIDYITTRSFKFQWDDAIKLIRPKYVMAKKRSQACLPFHPHSSYKMSGNRLQTAFYGGRLRHVFL